MNSFLCQYNPEVTIYNVCPITKCWANFAEISTGCIFQYLRRNEITVYDLVIIQKQSKKQVEQQFEDERQTVASYWKLLQELEHPAPTTVCQKCGILRETAGICLNQKNCTKRQLLYQQQCQTAPLNGFNIQLTPAHFYVIFTVPEFRQLLDPYCVDPATLDQAHEQQQIIRGIYSTDYSEDSDGYTTIEDPND